MHSRTVTGLMAATLAALALAGCGSDPDYANDPRPPAPINVTAAITPEKITVSPLQFGAGPIVLIIANETQEPQRVTLETDELAGSQGGIKQSTSPINPDGTATLKVDVREGDYAVSVDGAGIKPARVTVGPERESAQNDLLQP
jgi:hypothetical protein